MHELQRYCRVFTSKYFFSFHHTFHFPHISGFNDRGLDIQAVRAVIVVFFGTLCFSTTSAPGACSLVVTLLLQGSFEHRETFQGYHWIFALFSLSLTPVCNISTANVPTECSSHPAVAPSAALCFKFQIKKPSSSLHTITDCHISIFWCFFKCHHKSTAIHPVWQSTWVEHQHMDQRQQEDSFCTVWQLGTKEPPALKLNSPFSEAVKHCGFYSHQIRPPFNPSAAEPPRSFVRTCSKTCRGDIDLLWWLEEIPFFLISQVVWGLFSCKVSPHPWTSSSSFSPKYQQKPSCFAICVSRIYPPVL